jgi:hypothetical protein
MTVDEIRALLTDERVDSDTFVGTSCKISRKAEVKVNGPFILPEDPISSVLMDETEFPRGAVRAREVSLEESLNSGGTLPRCPVPGIRIPETPIARRPLMIEFCTLNDATGLCPPNSPSVKQSPIIGVRFADSMKRGEPLSCRFPYPRLLPEKMEFCPARALVRYRFNEGPGTGEEATTLITELIAIPSRNMLIFFANLICSGNVDCFNRAVEDLA